MYVDLICLHSFIRVPNDGDLDQDIAKWGASKRFLKMDFNLMQRATPQKLSINISAFQVIERSP